MHSAPVLDYLAALQTEYEKQLVCGEELVCELDAIRREQQTLAETDEHEKSADPTWTPRALPVFPQKIDHLTDARELLRTSALSSGVDKALWDGLVGDLCRGATPVGATAAADQNQTDQVQEVPSRPASIAAAAGSTSAAPQTRSTWSSTTTSSDQDHVGGGAKKSPTKRVVPRAALSGPATALEFLILRTLEQEVRQTLNRARREPKALAAYLSEERNEKQFQGKGGKELRRGKRCVVTKEGYAVVREAVAYLEGLEGEGRVAMLRGEFLVGGWGWEPLTLLLRNFLVYEFITFWQDEGGRVIVQFIRRRAKWSEPCCDCIVSGGGHMIIRGGGGYSYF